MNAGSRRGGPARDPVDLCKRATADDGQTSAERLVQSLYRPGPAGIRQHGVGGFGQRREDTVQIKEQGDPPIEADRRMRQTCGDGGRRHSIQTVFREGSG